MTSAPQRVLSSLRGLLPSQERSPERTLYNPAPELGGAGGIREGASWDEWEAMKARLPPGEAVARSVMDVGCANGFFTLRMAGEGYTAIGVEQNPESVRAANDAVRAGGATGVCFMVRQMTPESIAGLPAVNIVVFKSVFQQWAVAFGWETAVGMLGTLWGKAGDSMFFETAESLTCKPEYAEAMPDMGATEEANRAFVQDLLAGLDGAADVACLGYFPVEYRQESRHLFVVRRAT